jgi:hypothetical protein
VEGGHPGVAEGSRVTLNLRRGPITFTWEARHRDIMPGRQFVDEQVRGPFARWVHTHRFVPGIGGETARRLAAGGWRLILRERDPERLEPLARSLGATPVGVKRAMWPRWRPRFPARSNSTGASTGS